MSECRGVICERSTDATQVVSMESTTSFPIGDVVPVTGSREIRITPLRCVTSLQGLLGLPSAQHRSWQHRLQGASDCFSGVPTRYGRGEEWRSS